LQDLSNPVKAQAEMAEVLDDVLRQDVVSVGFFLRGGAAFGFGCERACRFACIGLGSPATASRRFRRRWC